MKLAALTPLALLLACATAGGGREVPGCREGPCTHIGEPVDIGPSPGELVVTPLEVLEDSRCPIEADCVWAGRVRLRAELQLGHEVITVELGTEAPLDINDGLLSLVEVAPEMSVEWTPLAPQDYEFGFSWVPHSGAAAPPSPSEG